MTTTIKTRFAPSPTGFLHIGGVRTCLFNYLYAKQNKGTYLLRIDDTDKARNKEEWTDALMDDFLWLGLKWDEFARQSENTALYTEKLKQLIEKDLAYISKEIPKEEGQRDEVIRFRNPNKVVTFTDLIRGEVSVDTTDLGDFVLARSLDEAVYHFASVVDDIALNVTHVIRAEEHLSNTPRQILIIEALGGERPIYAHLPLVLAEDKSKLSKRKHGEKVSLTYYRNLGYLPQAIINLVALMGWNPGTEQELLSMDELIEKFDITKVQKGGAVFNVEKLNWLNREYIKKMPPKDQLENVLKFVSEGTDAKIIEKILPTLLDRIHTFGDVAKLFEAGDFSYVFETPVIETDKLLFKGEGNLSDTARHITYVADALEKHAQGGGDASPEAIKALIWPYAEENGRGSVLWPVRYALTGKDKSPDPFTVISILGFEESIARLKDVVAHIA